MKVFIFAYNRFDTMTTSEYFKEVPHTVLCHSNEDKQRFIDGGRIFTKDLQATNNQKGLAYQRNTALDQMREGEWAVFFVDDLIRMTYLEGYEDIRANALDVTMENQKQYRQLFKKPLSAQRFIELTKKDIFTAETRGLALVGYSLTENPLFRRKRYGFWSLADGRCWLVKKTHLRFDNQTQLIDDTCWTAKNLKTFGGVVVNNWILPLCKRYTAGAFGSIQERMPQKIREASYLVENYPDFIAFADKKGWPPKSHVKIKPRRGARA